MRISVVVLMGMSVSAIDAKVSTDPGGEEPRSLWSAPAWNKWSKPTGRPVHAWNGWNWDGHKWNWSWGGGWGPQPTDKPTQVNSWDNSWSGKGSSDWVLNGWGGDTWTSTHAWAGNGWSWSPKNPDAATSPSPSLETSSSPSAAPSVSAENAEEPDFPANRLKFNGTAVADNSGCRGDNETENMECERSVQFGLRETLQGILCDNVPEPFLRPCDVTVKPLENRVQDAEGGRRLQASLYDFIIYLTVSLTVTTATIVEAAEKLYDTTAGSVVQTMNTIPYENSPIPQDIVGYQFVGHGYCVDSQGEGFSSACEYVNVFDIQTCLTLCKVSPCFNAANGFTLAGIDWITTETGLGTCFCLKQQQGETDSCPDATPQPDCGHQTGDGVGAVWFTTYPDRPLYSCFRAL